MNRILYISLTALIFLTCCNKSTKTCQEMPDTTFSDSELDLPKWAYYNWVPLPQNELDSVFKTELLLIDAKQEDIENIISDFKQELGEPFVTSETLQKDLIPNFHNLQVFFLPNQRYAEEGEHVFWWENQDHNAIIRLYTIDEVKDLDMPAAAIISFFDMDALSTAQKQMEKEK